LDWTVVCEFTACPVVDTVTLCDGTIAFLEVPLLAATSLTVNDNTKTMVKISNGTMNLALLSVLELKLSFFVIVCFLIFSPPL
jgi:hypothetical protein